MADTYQAVYDAVRSRIGSVDIGDSVESALRNAFGNADHHFACIAQNYAGAAFEQMRPFVLLKPILTLDGNQWCALYGSDLQMGVAGFGDSPELASRDFDRAWKEPVTALASQPRSTT